MDKKKIILIGGGGHCKSCIDVIESNNMFDIVGIVEKTKDKIGGKVLGYPIIGCDNDLKMLRKEFKYAHITVGHIKSNQARRKVFNLVDSFQYELPVIIAASAIVSKYSRIARGSIVMHHSIINANSIIGENCIVNSKALIEHDSIIGDHCHIATDATLNGNVVIGDNCFIGSNSTILNDINIIDNVIVGASSLIRENINNKGTYVGLPGKRINP